MLIEMAVFDAFGAGFEYADSNFVRKHLRQMVYVRHPKWQGPPGRYTDDTQMALGLAELMLQKSPSLWTHYDVAAAFVMTFKRDPRPGYSGAFFQMLLIMQSGWDFLRMVVPNSEKSGGAMRAGVLGLLPDLQDVVRVARFQASLTHCTQMGMDAAVASALMVHYFYYRLGTRADLPEWLDRQGLCFRFDKPWLGYVDSLGCEHVLAALTAICQNDTLDDVLHACVAFTGDVDTVAAIAAPAAVFCDEIEQNLSAPLLRGLEKGGSYGRTYLGKVDAKLMARYPRPQKVEPVVESEATLITDLFLVREEEAGVVLLDNP